MSSSRDKMRNSLKRLSNESLKTQMVNIDDIRLDTKTQARVEINNDIIQEYAELMANGTKFPPIVVYYDEQNYYLADGYHRYYAMKANDITGNIEVDKYKGTIRDAILYSLSANTTHGLRRTNEDKRKAILTLLQDNEWNKYSAVKIAKLAGVNDKTVGNIKKELGLNTANIIGEDGREYNFKTTSENPKSNKTRKKYYRFKMEVEYKNGMKEIVKESKLNESALLKEAFEYLQNKYLIK